MWRFIDFRFIMRRMPWYEMRTFRRGPALDPRLPKDRPVAQSDVQLVKFDNVEAAMAEAARVDQALGEAGFVSVYNEGHEKIWPRAGRH